MGTARAGSGDRLQRGRACEGAEIPLTDVPVIERQARLQRGRACEGAEMARLDLGEDLLEAASTGPRL